jgi:FimV-like protein
MKRIPGCVVGTLRRENLKDLVMRRLSLLLPLSLAFVSPVEAARCTGSANCGACSNCSRCAYCKGGGTCGVCSSGFSPSRYTPDLPAPRLTARTTARTAARTTYRREARTGSNEGASQEAIANSRLQIARKLIDLGKKEAARGWLLKVIDANASPTTTEEARGLLANIEGRKKSPMTRSALGNQSRTPLAVVLNPSPVARSTTARYFAQTTATGSVRPHQLAGPIGVLESRDSVKLIGTASEVGPGADGLAEWTLVIRSSAVPGRFVIVDREFREVAK